MPRVLVMPSPKRHCLVVVFNRREDGKYRLELLDAETGESILIIRKLVLYDVVTKMQSLSCTSEAISLMIDTMLSAQQSIFVGTDLTDAQIADFRRRQF